MIERVIRYEVVCDECKESYPEEFRCRDAAHFTALMRDWKTISGESDSKRKFYCPRCCKKLNL